MYRKVFHTTDLHEVVDAIHHSFVLEELTRVYPHGELFEFGTLVQELESLRANGRSSDGGGGGIGGGVMEGESGDVASSFGTEFDEAVAESFEVVENDVLEGFEDGFGFVVDALAGCQQASDVDSVVVLSIYATASEFVGLAPFR